jgi:hypothetical protein
MDMQQIKQNAGYVLGLLLNINKNKLEEIINADIKTNES